MSRATDSAAMRRDWDERARKNAFYYIASWDESWDLESFFKSGETDYESLAEPALAALGFAPAGKNMLEIGCGVGRMTRAFAARFERVYALDISSEMLRRGQSLHETTSNIVWVQGDGSGLSMFEDCCLDFVFSYIVLQHLPTKHLVLNYVREILRVLRPGGAFHLQFNSRREPTMNWKGRLAWGVLDRLRNPISRFNLGKVSYRLASLIGLDPLAAGYTWRGAVVDLSEVSETIHRSGGMIVGVNGEGTRMTWCFGRKSGLVCAGIQRE